MSPRLAFVVNATVGALPAMVGRAAEIADVRSAHVGSTLQGGVRARIRGILPIGGARGPRIDLEVEERTLALEARGFAVGAADAAARAAGSARQRLARWLPALAVLGIVVLRAAGAPI